MANILALHTQKNSSLSHYDDLIGFGIGLAPGHRVNQRWDNFWCSDYLYHGSYVIHPTFSIGHMYSLTNKLKGSTAKICAI